MSKSKRVSSSISSIQEQDVLTWLIPRLEKSTLTDFIDELMYRSKKTLLTKIFTPNPEQVELAQRTPPFSQALSQAEVLLPDGSGLVWAAQRRGVSLQRITGREVVERWLSLPLQNLPKTLLLGGKPGVAESVARGIDPTGHRVRGTHGYADVKKPSPAEESSVMAMIAKWQPSVVFVGFGAPRQEYWILEHADELEEAGVRVIMAVGGAFDVLSGSLKAPPKWITDLNIEWLYRLIQEPMRWRRQLWLLRFALRVIR